MTITKPKNKIHLGINIDHVATLRNARGQGDPSLLELAFAVADGGADSLTLHLREDRRHIVDADLFEIKKHNKLPINLEMALTGEMLEIALALAPRSVCIVPEKREEVTTEGGLNTAAVYHLLEKFVPALKKNEIEVYLFVEAEQQALGHALELGCHGVEVHTGSYALQFSNAYAFAREFAKISEAALFCQKNRLEFHAGHGLNYHNVFRLLEIENLSEVNIGHAIIARALKTGMQKAVADMKQILAH